MKVLTPQTLAAAIIGRGGGTIVEMERNAQASIGISKINELYPNSDSRVLVATAETEAALNEVARLVLEKLVDVYSRSQSEMGSDENQLRISMLVPKAAIASLIADSGKGVRLLCETSGAMIKIRDPLSGNGPDASQEVQLRGRAQALEAAMREINHEVQLTNSEPWFSAWSQAAMGVPHTSSASSPKEGSSRSEPRQTSPERAPNGQSRCAMKVLAPPALAKTFAAAALTELEQRVQAKVRLADENFMRMDCRVLAARAENEETLNAVAEWITERLAEAAECDPGNDSVSWDGSLKLSILMPKAAAAGLIGRGGTTIKQLCELSGAHIKVRDNQVFGTGPDSTQKVDVRGSAKGIMQVLREVNTQVTSLREEAWFDSWASASSSVSKPLPARSSPAAEAGMELVGRTMEGLPSYVLEESRGFAMTCTVPCRLIGHVKGRGAGGVQEVQRETKTRIVLRDIPEDTDNQSMTIAGPLLNTCSAYMLMMKRYLDAEREVMNGR